MSLGSLKLEWLHQFVVLAKSQDFQSAADELFLTRTAVSKSLSQLEQSLGLTLIERHQKQEFRLTPMGKLFYAKASQLLAETQTIEHSFRGESLKLEGELRLGLEIFWKDPRLYPALTRFRKAHPYTRTLVHGNHGYQIEIGLKRGLFSLGFLSYPPQHRDLAARTLSRLPCVIVQGGPPRQREWQELQYIHWSAGNMDANLLWPAERFPRQISLTVKDSLRMAIFCAQAGLGALLAPQDLLILDALADKSLHIAASAPFETHVQTWLVWNPEHPRSQATQIFLDYL